MGRNKYIYAKSTATLVSSIPDKRLAEQCNQTKQCLRHYTLRENEMLLQAMFFLIKKGGRDE
jgi:ERCC4-type nuclease